MSHSATNLLQTIDKRVLVGLIAFAIAAVVGATSLAAAQTTNKPDKTWCAQQGYKNYGQCVSVWAKAHGYVGVKL